VPLEVNVNATGKLEQILIDPNSVGLIRTQVSKLFGIDESKIYPDRLDFIALEVRRRLENRAMERGTRSDGIQVVGFT
jgi:hypothetical protein